MTKEEWRALELLTCWHHILTATPIFFITIAVIILHEAHWLWFAGAFVVYIVSTLVTAYMFKFIGDRLLSAI